MSLKIKASERQTILNKLVGVLRKKYGRSEPHSQRPVFESLLFAACLEDAQTSAAEAALQRLRDGFYDLNEIRVSSISQIERHLTGLSNPSWRALRIRDALHTVFETHYKFDLEHLKRKTHEQALKELAALRHSSFFMRMYVLQHCLGAHVLPLDASSLSLLKWLGLVEPEATQESAAEELKTSVRKSDAGLLCHLLREFACDPAFAHRLHLSAQDRKSGVNPHEAVERLTALLASGGARKRAVVKGAGRGPAVTKTHKKPPARPEARRGRTAATTAPVKKKLTKKPAVPPRKRR